MALVAVFPLTPGSVAVTSNVTLAGISTESGKTARVVSKFRPNVPILTFVLNEKVYHQLSLAWGIWSINEPNADNLDALIKRSNDEAKAIVGAVEGDIMVITAGVPLGSKGSTNLLRIERVK